MHTRRGARRRQRGGYRRRMIRQCLSHPWGCSILTPSVTPPPSSARGHIPHTAGSHYQISTEPPSGTSHPIQCPPTSPRLCFCFPPSHIRSQGKLQLPSIAILFQGQCSYLTGKTTLTARLDPPVNLTGTVFKLERKKIKRDIFVHVPHTHI